MYQLPPTKETIRRLLAGTRITAATSRTIRMTMEDEAHANVIGINFSRTTPDVPMSGRLQNATKALDITWQSPCWGTGDDRISCSVKLKRCTKTEMLCWTNTNEFDVSAQSSSSCCFARVSIFKPVHVFRPSPPDLKSKTTWPPAEKAKIDPDVWQEATRGPNFRVLCVGAKCANASFS